MVRNHSDDGRAKERRALGEPIPLKPRLEACVIGLRRDAKVDRNSMQPALLHTTGLIAPG